MLDRVNIPVLVSMTELFLIYLRDQEKQDFNSKVVNMDKVGVVRLVQILILSYLDSSILQLPLNKKSINLKYL